MKHDVTVADITTTFYTESAAENYAKRESRRYGRGIVVRMVSTDELDRQRVREFKAGRVHRSGRFVAAAEQ